MCLFQGRKALNIQNGVLFSTTGTPIRGSGVFHALIKTGLKKFLLREPPSAMISATTSEAEPRHEEIASHATTAQTNVTAVPTDATVPTDETALTNEVNNNFKIFLFAQTS